MLSGPNRWYLKVEKIAAAPGSGYGAFPGQTFIEPSDGDVATVCRSIFIFTCFFTNLCLQIPLPRDIYLSKIIPVFKHFYIK